MNKLKTIFRRLYLGNKYKHQYTCHPDFDLKRHSDHYTVIWKKKEVGTVGAVKSLKNSFSGTCFTVASGPSIGDIDFDLLAPYDSISLNCAIKKFSTTHFKPRHSLIVDRRIFENQWPCVRDSILSGALCFFSYVGLSRICEREPELLQKGNIYLIEGIGKKFGVPRPSISAFYNLYKNDPEIFMDEKYANYGGTIGFSTNAEKGFFSGKTIATWAVQLAHYLGYQNNYILGMDLGGTGKKHFYDDSNNRPPDFMRDYEPYIRVCFEQARRAADQKGFYIFNLSKHSSLPGEIIPKIAFEAAMALAANNNTSERN